MKLSEVIKQKPGSKNCIACVAAMATGTTVEDFEKVRGKKESYNIIDLVAYMFHNKHTPEFFRLEDATSEMFLHDLRRFNFTQIRSVLLVKSETKPEFNHVVYCDGFWCYDPNPGVNEKRRIDSYDVIGVLPITEFTERPEWWEGTEFD